MKVTREKKDPGYWWLQISPANAAWLSRCLYASQPKSTCPASAATLAQTTEMPPFLVTLDLTKIFIQMSQW